MLKFILIALISFGAFMALAIFVPTSTHTAFTVSGHAVPWMVLAVCGCAYLGYRVIK